MRGILAAAAVVSCLGGFALEARGQTGWGIRKQTWLDIGGDYVTDLTGAADYPDNPDADEVVGSFEGERDWAANYGTRFRGYILPPTTGQYVFWITSDNESRLFLSTDDTPDNATQIAAANVTGWDWWDGAGQESVPVTFTGGQKYYIEALHKEGVGNDYVRVRWQLPGGAIEQPVPGHRLEPYYETPPELTTIEITPSPAYCMPGDAVQFIVAPLDQYGGPFPATVDIAVDSGGALDVTSATTDRTTNPTITTTFTSDGSEGTATVTATSGAVTGQAAIEVAAAYLAAVGLTPAVATITTAETLTVTAEPVDQTGAPIAATVTWSALPPGPTLVPTTGTTDGSNTTTNTTFSPNGASGMFVVTAEATDGTDTVLAMVTVEVIVFEDLLRINCGTNQYEVAGWQRDDPYVTGGRDFTFSVFADTAGVAGAAPPNVYRTCRQSWPDTTWALSIPADEAPDGRYQVRIHFFDEHNDNNRAMDITIEGVLVLDDFNIYAEAGVGKALVKMFEVTVADGDGLQIVADRGLGNDVFFSGLELISLPPPEFTSVEVTPETAYVLPSGYVAFTATPLDQYGDPFAGTTVTWTVTGGGAMNPGTGETSTFESDGTEGTFTITASATDDTTTYTDTAAVEVSAPHVTTVNVTPLSAVISLGGAREFTAEVLDQFGETITASITWDDGSAGGSFDTTAGDAVVYTAPATEQTVTITATADSSVSGTSTVTVTSGPVLAEIVVTPAAATAAPGGSVNFTAEARDQFGDPFAGVTIAWTVSGGGTLSPATGDTTTFTAGATPGGSFTVTAASGSVTGTAEVTVEVLLPGAFALLLPDGSSKLDPTVAVVFTWEASSAATGYTFELSRDEAFSLIVVDQPGLAATSVAVLGGQLGAGKAYYWRVTAQNAEGETPASNAPVSFETSAPPKSDSSGCRAAGTGGGAPGGQAVPALLALLVLLAAAGRSRARLS